MTTLIFMEKIYGNQSKTLTGLIFIPKIKKRKENKKMKAVDTYNAAVGAVVAILSYVFGPHWFLFAIFLLLNVFDWITCLIKSNKTGNTSSKAGLWGIMKKF